MEEHDTAAVRGGSRSLPAGAPNPWWVGIVSGMASFIDSLAIVSSGTALVLYQNEYGLTNTQYGFLSASLTIAIAFGALLGGRLGDKYGRKPVFSITMALIVVGSLLLTFTTTFIPLAIGMACVGLGTGADLPVSLATIAEFAEDRNRGKIVGMSNLLWQIGIVGAQILGTVVGNWGRRGGQILFGNIGLVAFIVLLLRLTIPESEIWQKAHDENKRGVSTVRADNAGLRDLLAKPYAKPFIALLLFYALGNLGPNTGGQFGTWINVHIIHMSVSLSSLIQVVMYPVSLLFFLLFMKVVDTDKRMPLFYAGMVCFIGSYFIYVIFGFSIATYIAHLVVNGFGGAFAFEGIMKVWTQESFPTLLRTTAQGSVVFAGRIVAGVVGTFTANVVAWNPRAAYAGLGVLMMAAYAFALWGFHGRQRNVFATEGQTEEQMEGQPDGQVLASDDPASAASSDAAETTAMA